jgi:hypothetical protein
MINFKSVKLGKKRAVFDPRTFKLSKYLRKLPIAPAAANWLKLPSWPMYGNDTLGDCVEAAAGHIIDLCESYTAPTNPEPTTAQIIKAYSGCAGYVPGESWTDNGTDMLSFLKYWRNIGVGGHKILAYMSLTPGDLAELKLAIWLFGSAFIGVQLPVSAQGASEWSVPNGFGGAGAPGSWGGHCIPVGAYSGTQPARFRNTVVTWGQTLTMSDYFYRVYNDEAYAVLSQDWMNAHGVAPNMFDLSTLEADLASL